MEIKKIIVDESGKRIDKYISEKLDLTRSRVQKLIDDGMVTINGNIAKSSAKVNEGEVLSVEIPELKPLEIVPEEIPLKDRKSVV